MSGKYLVDTNVFARILRGDSDLDDRLNAAGETYLCTHVAGELYYGVFKSTQVQKNLADVNQILEETTFLKCDDTTSLRKNGTMLPENDIWIAAVALQYGLTLATDDGHFDAIPHLAKERW